eukprot:GFYU01004677.1.p1 GENE.GFYU01004677.1~~GFYU01004677.1.p1  ORF type:complete len:507 (+),score=147.76 GFYU01004677.1:70-1590(+)
MSLRIIKPALRRGHSATMSVQNAAYSTQHQHILSPNNMNTQVVNAEYAVRGELVLKAQQYAQQIKQNPTGHGLPFDSLVFCNIGNPQSLHQKPITFFRQVISACINPELHTMVEGQYPKDVLKRAEEFLANSDGTGAYSASQGIDLVRQSVANFIERRDGYKSDINDIFVTDGASPAVQMALKCMIRTEADGVMIPIPQYPLYSAAITLNSGTQVRYYLDEHNHWGLNVDELRRSLAEAREENVNVRGLAIINPGNPTGQVLTKENMVEILDFCHRERIVLMADEVYQENIYSDRPFHSFKKVLMENESRFPNFELMSFHSCSKGFLGECGARGGYVEMHGIHPEVKQHYYKLASVSLCSNVVGQLMVSLMTNPPRKGDPSFELYEKERTGIIASLKTRAEKLSVFLNSLDGVTCNDAQGAMYAFPQIHLPAKMCEAAAKENKSPDTFYALHLLQSTGIVVVPGSGFGQEEGTFHFRTTFLPQEDQMDTVMERMSTFHSDFMAQYK